MIDRTMKPTLTALFEKYPVVTVTGPRQAGKTTLCRATFPHLAYFNLERPDQREFAIEDPRGFLRGCEGGAIVDEIQRAPDLVSYIQAVVDERRRSGQFVLTGSRQFRVAEAVSQSLAGRTAVLRLLPLSLAEASQVRPSALIDERILTGFYPRIYDHGLDPAQALGDYFETYVERDVRQVSEIRNLTAFQKFTRLCAGRVGQLLNLHSLGNDVGVSHTTARQWLSVLEASYVVFRLEPFHANISKRLVKSPKLYFYDVGLAAHLMGIESSVQVATHPLRGFLFENMVVIEALKHRFNQGRRSNLSFYRDSSGTEVDLLYSLANRVVAIEIKAGETISGSLLASLRKLGSQMPETIAARILVHGSDADAVRDGIRITGPSGFIPTLEAAQGEVVQAPDGDRNG